MSKLLKAGFARLFQNRLYHVGLLFSVGISIFGPILRYMDIKKHPDVYAAVGPEFQSVEGFVFSFAMMLVFAMTVVTTMYIGTEYSDGTIRNKIIAGHKRSHIYLTNYLVCAAANLSMLLISYLAAFGVGRRILPESYMSAGEIILRCLSECATILGFTAVLVLIAMLVQSKAGASVAALLLTMVLFILAMMISSSLVQPEYKEHQVISALEDENGNLYHEADIVSEKNPKYLSGTKRVVYEQLDVILSLNQIMRIADDRVSDDLGIMGLYAVFTVIAAAGIGMFCFRKMDLK